MAIQLKRTSSFSSGLARAVDSPPVSPTSLAGRPSIDTIAEDASPKPSRPPYSFLGVVLAQFADEPAPVWSQQGEACPRFEHLSGKTSPSVLQRVPLSPLGSRSSGPTLLRVDRSFITSEPMSRQRSDLDPKNDHVEFSVFDADDADLADAHCLTAPLTEVCYRLAGSSPSEASLRRISIYGPRRNSLIPATPAVDLASTRSAFPSNPETDLHVDDACASDPVEIRATAFFPPPESREAYVSIPLTLPSLVPLPNSPAPSIASFELEKTSLRSTTLSSAFSDSSDASSLSTQPSIPSSPVLSTRAAEYKPVLLDPPVLGGHGDGLARRNRFERLHQSARQA